MDDKARRSEIAKELSRARWAKIEDLVCTVCGKSYRGHRAARDTDRTGPTYCSNACTLAARHPGSERWKKP